MGSYSSHKCWVFLHVLTHKDGLRARLFHNNFDTSSPLSCQQQQQHNQSKRHITDSMVLACYGKLFTCYVFFLLLFLWMAYDKNFFQFYCSLLQKELFKKRLCKTYICMSAEQMFHTCSVSTFCQIAWSLIHARKMWDFITYLFVCLVDEFPPLIHLLLRSRNITIANITGNLAKNWPKLRKILLR